MTILEIIFIIIGLGAVILSYKVSVKPDMEETEQESAYVDDITSDMIRRKVKDYVDEELDNLKESIIDETKEELSGIANEKIIGIGEYSDNILDKIQKNHEEVVFLYNMLNEKDDELKKLINKADIVKADINDAVALDFEKINQKLNQMNELSKSMELLYVDMKQNSKNNMVNAGANKVKKNDSDDSLDENISSDVQTKNKPKASAIDALSHSEDKSDNQSEKASLNSQKRKTSVNKKKPELSEVKEKKEDTDVKKEAEPKDINKNDSTADKITNNNDKIIELYKKGRSVLEISQMLSLGQGEVKLVVDMYRLK